MLTGVVPFNADTPLAIALKQVSEAPAPPRTIVSTIPAELERVVLHALQKNPSARPRNADDLRAELHATAEELGFEQADSRHSPSFDDLRSHGTESPSGRLVIDLATLRQVQAAAGQNTTDAAGSLSTAGTVPLSPENVRPEFNRVSVPLEKPSSKRAQLLVLAIFLLIVIAGSGLLATRWWGGNGLIPSNVPANTDAAASPSPTPTATPTPTPRPATTPAPTPKKSPEKKPGPLKKVFNKLKGIFS
jgi:serine/threonine-protein kinase